MKGRTIQDLLGLGIRVYIPMSSLWIAFILKLDFSQAFDTIEHPAMIEVMRHMDFSHSSMGYRAVSFNAATGGGATR